MVIEMLSVFVFPLPDCRWCSRERRDGIRGIECKFDGIPGKIIRVVKFTKNTFMRKAEILDFPHCRAKPGLG